MNHTDKEIEILDDPCLNTTISKITCFGKTFYLGVKDDGKIYITRITRTNPDYDPTLASENRTSLVSLLQKE